MAFGAAPRMARCEQKVCRSTWEPIRRSPVRLQANRSAASIADWVKGLSPLQGDELALSTSLPDSVGSALTNVSGRR